MHYLTDGDYSATRSDWSTVLDLARFSAPTTAIGSRLAQFGNADGRRIFPGLKRLTVSTRYSYNTVKKALATLRQAGMIEAVSAPSRQGWAVEYRLIVAPDLMDRLDGLGVELWTPARFDMEVERVAAAHRRPYTAKGEMARAAGDKLTAGAWSSDFDPDDADDRAPQPTRWAEPEASTAHDTTANRSSTAHLTMFVQPTPRPPTTEIPLTTPTTHTPVPVWSDRTVSRASADDPPAPAPAGRCRHGFRARRRPDGTSSCALCRRAERRTPAPAPHGPGPITADRPAGPADPGAAG